LFVGKGLVAQEDHNSARDATSNANAGSKVIVKYLGKLGYMQRLVLCCAMHYCYNIITSTCVCSCITSMLKELGIRFEQVFDSWRQCINRVTDAIQRLCGKGKNRSGKPKILIPVDGGYKLTPPYEDLLDESICKDVLKKLIDSRKRNPQSITSHSINSKGSELLQGLCSDGDDYIECIYKLYDPVFEGKADLIRIGHSNAKNMLQELRYLYLKGYLILEIAQWLAQQRIGIGEVSVKEVRALEKNR
jgi:hypothetical protein